ncbi:MAG TPA: DNA polymerase III subunit delta' [Syntrophales bacterium]|nr:DNA polymerase III subunit delta' [Syntrophales bacterium]HRV42705.1 DNA polymerase III subunit delta' [Syntrophales bacterium]
MSYRGIRGHDGPIALLKRAVAKGRVAHAYLFCGMDGIGKKKVATAFARALLCRDARDGEGCGVCGTCLKIERACHPDVLTLAPEGAFIKIGEIRGLMEMMALHPLEGPRRVVIVDEADRMNPPAANALLKTLEEPTAANTLILVTSRPLQLPPTILSRCQRLTFSPLAAAEVALHLREEAGLDGETAAFLAAAAGGSIRHALLLHKEGYLKRCEEIVLCAADETRPRPLRVLSLISLLGRERDNLAEALGILKVFFRDALVLAALGPEAPVVLRERRREAEGTAVRLGTKALLRNCRLLDEALRLIEQNANKTLTLETTVFKLAL